MNVRPRSFRPRHRQGRRKLRSVRFASNGARVAWGALGLCLLGGGYWLISPTLSRTPETPYPWGLWISTNARPLTSQPGVGWLLELSVDPERGCDESSTVEGRLTWSTNGSTSLTRIPTQLALGIAGTKLLGAAISSPESERWRMIPVQTAVPGVGAPGVYVAVGTTSHWPEEQAVRFRLTLQSSRSAGFGACDVVSPALFQYQSSEEFYEPALLYGGGYLAEHGFRLAHAPLTDARVTMAVPGERPERGELTAGAQIRRAALLQVSCSGESSPVPSSNPATEQLENGRRSSCASIETFRDSDAVDDANRRTFFSGILISAAIGILLEAALTGTLDRDEKDRTA